MTVPGRWLSTGALALLLVGCEEPRRDSGAPITDFDASAPAFDAVARPARTYWVKNESGSCSVYWEEGQRESVPGPIRCPREIEPGESMRLADSTCIRHSDTAERNRPVRCVGALFYARDADATGGKEYPEYRLPPKPP